MATSPERLAELKTMEAEFTNQETTDERRIEILTKMREFANEEIPESKCIQCKQSGFYAPYEYALIEGHCYSQDGLLDYTRITKMCEFCFDTLFPDEEDEGYSNNGYCEDYPCCGHTDGDPCPGRPSPVTEPWYCDMCGYNHISTTCPAEF